MLRSASLDSLAAGALDSSQPAALRLEQWEALLMRIEESVDNWSAYGQHGRSAIKRACALNLAALGFAAAIEES
jgi:hypothetical protein